MWLSCMCLLLWVGHSHVLWWGVPGAAVSVGVQVVQRAVELLVDGLRQGRGAATQCAGRAASQQAGRAPSQQPRRAAAHQAGRVSAQQAVAAAAHGARGAAVHEAGGPEQRQGGLCQGRLLERERERVCW